MNEKKIQKGGDISYVAKELESFMEFIGWVN